MVDGYLHPLVVGESWGDSRDADLRGDCDALNKVSKHGINTKNNYRKILTVLWCVLCCFPFRLCVRSFVRSFVIVCLCGSVLSIPVDERRKGKSGRREKRPVFIDFGAQDRQRVIQVAFNNK